MLRLEYLTRLPNIMRLVVVLGVYVYTEASIPRKEGDVARLISKTFDSKEVTHCLSFFYHMFSVNKAMMGSLKVYLRDDIKQRNILMVQNGSLDQNEWMQRKITFKPKGSYQVTRNLSN